MSQAVQPEEKKSQVVDKDIGNFGMWVNDHIVGNPVTFVICILAVVAVYAAIPVVGGYNKWNTGLGLFFNTLSSSFELITGVGAVVGVVVLHKAHQKQKKSLDDLHSKLDAVLAKR
jgi:low affinity Fe/Cu permease